MFACRSSWCARPVTTSRRNAFLGPLDDPQRAARVLIHSTAGGVGLAAIELARTRNCEIFGIASAGKHDFLRERGCHHPIDSAADYVAEVTRAIGGKAVDLVLDPVGGKSWTQGYALLAPAGRLVMIGLRGRPRAGRSSAAAASGSG